MRLYNTLTRSVEPIKPLNPPKVTVYTCGPTVYDYPHIGNWFTFIRYDLLIRTLKLTRHNPVWVMNITDVGHLVSDADEGEDKLEKGARREGKTAWDIAKVYTDYFTQGLERLRFTPPDYLPKATDHIQEQIELVKMLEAKGYTYKIDDGIYYDTSKFEGYADFARLDLDELQEGARVAVNEQKRNQSDFALWKFSPKDHKRDMEWDSPWGKGFPGWHLECSAMARKYLGDTVDIHAGGIDHIPVHHTNEIAQSEAATGKRFALIWMHTNHVLVNGDKISKSLGNGITLEEIEKQGFELDAFRFLVLQSQYRSQSKFDWDTLRSASISLKKIRDDFSWIYQSGIMNDEPQRALANDFAKAEAEITEVLSDDLNTPRAIAILHEMSGGFAGYSASQLDIPAVEHFAQFIDDALGIRILDKYELPESQKKLIEEREEARAAKNWDESDRIRSELALQRIGVRDTKFGPIWYRLKA